MIKIIIFIIVTTFLVIGTSCVLWGGEKNEDPKIYTQPEILSMQKNEVLKKLKIEPPSLMIIEPEKNHIAVLKTTAGGIKIKLYSDKTPITANNFVYLAKAGFYNDTIFHRTIKGFMIQGGDPKGDGTGGPGYRFKDEPFNGEYNRGIVAMANAGPDTNGSQFFIMHADYPLQPNYVIFGEVISGMKTVDKIAEAPVRENLNGEVSAPIEPIVIETIEILVEKSTAF